MPILLILHGPGAYHLESPLQASSRQSIARNASPAAHSHSMKKCSWSQGLDPRPWLTLPRSLQFLLDNYIRRGYKHCAARGLTQRFFLLLNLPTAHGVVCASINMSLLFDDTRKRSMMGVLQPWVADCFWFWLPARLPEGHTVQGRGYG